MPPKNTRKLTTRGKLHLIPERGQGLMTLQPGTKIQVSWSPGIGFALAYAQGFGGAMYTSSIRATEGPALFRNWPKEWCQS